MTSNKKRRVAIDKFVDFERREHEHLTVVADGLISDPYSHAIDWAERMFGALKRFGDRPVSEPLFWHFAFNGAEPEMNSFHGNVHKAFRELTGTQFIPLTEVPSLQTVLGSAALYAKAAYDNSNELELAWYAAVGVGESIPRALLDHTNPVA